MFTNFVNVLQGFGGIAPYFLGAFGALFDQPPKNGTPAFVKKLRPCICAQRHTRTHESKTVHLPVSLRSHGGYKNVKIHKTQTEAGSTMQAGSPKSRVPNTSWLSTRCQLEVNTLYYYTSDIIASTINKMDVTRRRKARVSVRVRIS